MLQFACCHLPNGYEYWSGMESSSGRFTRRCRSERSISSMPATLAIFSTGWATISPALHSSRLRFLRRLSAAASYGIPRNPPPPSFRARCGTRRNAPKLHRSASSHGGCAAGSHCGNARTCPAGGRPGSARYSPPPRSRGSSGARSWYGPGEAGCCGSCCSRCACGKSGTRLVPRPLPSSPKAPRFRGTAASFPCGTRVRGTGA